MILIIIKFGELLIINGLRSYMKTLKKSVSFDFQTPRKLGSRDGAVVRALASHQSGLGSIPGLGVIIMWVEFVVGSRLYSERFFSWYFGFPLSSKTNTSN